VNAPKSPDLDLRVLVLAPSSKDAAVAGSVFVTAGLQCECVSNLADLCARLNQGAGAIVVPEEAIFPDQRDCLAEWLRSQPPWSDLPVVVLARSGADSAAVAQAMDLFCNVTVLERPARVAALVSALRAALRARRRQYQNRDYVAARERSERELRDFFENASVGLHWVGPDGIILRVNQTELDMLGYQREEYVGHHIADFHTDKQLVEDILRRLAAGQTLSDYPAQLRCKDGSIRDVLIDSSVLWEDGRFIHTRCFTRDVTDRKLAEEALREASRRKDEFLAILAHELRNPLAPIQNSLHVLRMKDPGNAAGSRMIQMMERQVNHMVRLVDDLMEVSRVTRGKITLRKELVELESVLRSAMETSRPLIEAAHHDLVLLVSSEPCLVEGDTVRLAQVFSNLLNNSAKYTDNGGQIRVTVRRERDHVTVSVRDNGAGIPAEILPRVFDLFTQAERSIGRAQGGLGIGLTLVKTLVEMHGGTVHVHSEGYGKGSEFIVSLPLAAAPTLRRKERNDKLRPMAVRHRVLIVDDNRDAAESLGVLLEMLGADVRLAFSGAEGLETLKTYDADAVLLDIGMPGMDGYEVARRIRQWRDLTHITLIALTGWGQDGDQSRSKLAGFDHHLVKPPDLKKLETLLAGIHRRSEPRQSFN
jgi:PAS domain S-box-containing protein